MGLYSDAPPVREFSDDKPTLLVSWWITIFCMAIILTRLSGRYVRVEKLLREDKIVAGALVPLLCRAVCVHFILKYGTNNVDLNGLDLTPAQIDQRVIGSRLVMASRVFYAMVLWILKFTTMDFFGRLAGATRKKSHLMMIVVMRSILGATFVAVVISDLTECQPFANYWQVAPDPGGKCRQGFAQMIVMGSCNVVTDLLLIAFPIPIILSSQIAMKRKVLLVMLFSLALITVGITLYRMPRIIEENGSQVVRTMWASVEILAAIGVGNTVALGSFLRDSGVKKKKFNSSGYSNSRSQSQPTRVIRTLGSHWEDEDDDGHDLKTNNGVWDGVGSGSHTASDSISKSERRESKSSGERAPSPTQSHDSLITRDQFQASVEMNAPPSAVIAGGRGLHREGSTSRFNAI
ncbi:Fc.00g009970.m01.CDS01 [Cosmosporella sp. VM-42]